MAQNGKGPFGRTHPVIMFLRIAVLAALAWAIVTGAKMLMGG